MSNDAEIKNSDYYIDLLEKLITEEPTQKIVNEINLYKKVDLHPNVLKFHGITKIETDVIHHIDNYSLVLEYADSALQLASVVECLHEFDIIHCNLNANNILVHQKNIKLADFGLSKNIDEEFEESSDSSKLFAYVDPKFLNQEQNYELNEKSDVYSVGVLMWQISNGHQPFNNEFADYDLAHNIIDGKRENDVKGTPIEYINLYRECWKYEHNERPNIHKVVSTLRAIISHEQKDNNLLETYNSDANSSEEIIDTNHDLILDDISSMNLSYVDDSRSNSSLQDQITVKSKTQ
ncbi:unnamed protein product [Rhizophagus irregularis]|nr:unnamed protein product [Rhizophagus irregularis]